MKETTGKSTVTVSRTVTIASSVRIFNNFAGLSCDDISALIAERRRTAPSNLDALRLEQMKRIEEESRFLSKMTELSPKHMMMHFDI